MLTSSAGSTSLTLTTSSTVLTVQRLHEVANAMLGLRPAVQGEPSIVGVKTVGTGSASHTRLTLFTILALNALTAGCPSLAIAAGRASLATQRLNPLAERLGRIVSRGVKVILVCILAIRAVDSDASVTLVALGSLATLSASLTDFALITLVTIHDIDRITRGEGESPAAGDSIDSLD